MQSMRERPHVYIEPPHNNINNAQGILRIIYAFYMGLTRAQVRDNDD